MTQPIRTLTYLVSTTILLSIVACGGSDSTTPAQPGKTGTSGNTAASAGTSQGSGNSPNGTGNGQGVAGSDAGNAGTPGSGNAGAGNGNAGSGSAGSGNSGNGGSPGVTSSCAKLKPLRYWKTSPSAVATLFTAVDCTTEVPIPGLTTASFSVTEDGASLSSEAYQAVLPEQGYTVVVNLALDISNSTLPIRAQLVESAKAFVTEVMVTRKLTSQVRIGVLVFDGSPTLVTHQSPTSELATLTAKLDALATYTPVDGGSTNLNGAVQQAVAATTAKVASIMTSNLGGAVSTGHVLLFTDGADTAGITPASTASSAIAAARVFTSPTTTDQNPSPVVQTWAIGLKGADYNPTQLKTLIGSARHVIEANTVADLSQAFDTVGSQISAEVQSTYLFAYCSAKRGGQHTVAVGVRPTVIPQSQGLSFGFDATGFGPGCDAAFFAGACTGKGCGGLACGACAEGKTCTATSNTCG